MISKTYNISLDLRRVTAQPVSIPPLVVGDSGNVFVITLTNAGVPVNLSEIGTGTTRVLCVFSKVADGTTAEQGTDDGSVTIGGDNHNVITISPLHAGSYGAGKNNCEIQIYSDNAGDTVLVTTAQFNFDGRPSIMNEETIQSEEKYPVLLNLIDEVSGMRFLDVEASASETNEVTASAMRVGDAFRFEFGIPPGRNGQDGTSGVYVGSGAMPEGYNVQIDPTETTPTPAGNTSANANLLDNPWFTVNQREISTYTEGKYGVDRWKLVSGSATVSGSSITLNGTLRQIRENALGTNDFTASVKCTSGTATATYDDSTRYFDIVSSGGVIKAAKLELGSSSTLQYDAEPDYATELLKCQRYFLRIKKVGPSFLGTAMSFNNNTTLHFFIPAAVPMRVNPDATFSVNPVFLLRAAGSGKEPTSATFDYARCTGDGINMQFKDMTGVSLSTFTVYGIYLKGDIFFSADL